MIMLKQFESGAVLQFDAQSNLYVYLSVHNLISLLNVSFKARHVRYKTSFLF